MNKFVGSKPRRMPGRTFRPSELFSHVFPLLIRNLLQEELDDARLASLTRETEDAMLSEDECGLLSDRLEDWPDFLGYGVAAWHAQNCLESELPLQTTARFLHAELGVFRTFLQHSGGFRIKRDRDQLDEDDDADTPDGSDNDGELLL